MSYHDGTIITINDAQPRAEAVAVKNGKILAVGSSEELLIHKGEQTQLINLEGRLMPNAVATMKAVAEEGGFKIDVVSYPDVLVDRELIKREQNDTYVNRFRVAGAKLTIDGSPQGFTAWRDRPYYNPVGNYPPGYVGYPAATAEQVGDVVDWAFANDIQILTHANGEAPLTSSLLLAMRQ